MEPGPAARRGLDRGLVRQHERAGFRGLAPCRVHRTARAHSRRRRDGRGRGRRRPALADELRRLQALHARRLPRRLPDRGPVPHRVRHGRRPGGRLQRLRLLRARLPLRRHRPARGALGRPARAVHRRPGRAGLEVHALLRPARGRPRARVREGLPDRLDPVRPARRAARARRRAAGEAAGRGLERSAAVRARPGRRRRRRGCVLPPARRPRGVRAAARPGRNHARPARHVGDGRGRGRRARGGRRRGGVRRPVMSSVTTERGGDSYYGRPVLKEPVWKPEIPLYLFTGGVAGASGLLGLGARLAGNERLAKSSLYVGLAAEMVSPALLVSDLGRPERALNMFRVFKVTSPMSVGSWILLVSGGASNTAAALELVGKLKPVKVAAELVSALAGPPLATYTGTLLADTSIPVWHEARHELPWLFGASAASSAGAVAAIAVPVDEAGPARRLAVGASVAVLGLKEVMQHRLGFVGEVYKKEKAGSYGRISKVCTGAGAALLALAGKRSRAAAVAGGSLVLAGECALRWSVFRAGFQSARDPRYVVAPQRERKAARG